MTREEAKEILQGARITSFRPNGTARVKEALNMAIEALQDRPTGEWIEVEDYNGDAHYKCDQCGEEWTFPYGTPKENNANFCPNCGADMRGDNNETD